MAEQTGQRPNVIWVFGDQHRAQATGYMGDPRPTCNSSSPPCTATAI
ncbi:MAG: hypothetical protein JXA33_19615 [Anaerolineae bacterium]|nr:hypothetical protein [Anaerolineae bacterium]